MCSRDFDDDGGGDALDYADDYALDSHLNMHLITH